MIERWVFLYIYQRYIQDQAATHIKAQVDKEFQKYRGYKQLDKGSVPGEYSDV